MKALLLVRLAGCLGDTTPPQLSSFTPDDAEDLSGYGKVIVRAGVREDSGHALARLEIDGLGVEPQTTPGHRPRRLREHAVHDRCVAHRRPFDADAGRILSFDQVTQLRFQFDRPLTM